ncbi:flavodoxin family protein [Lutibacter flavus]|uniref:Multimeric flavodoxin WrbA n=1 Tax=Lutibacter flavus TaxID=691689 RepID=A0A238ZM80_9FLAO|nr:flavodoxin family protein [Lutibacter flavus]SNR83814.1 Multimeric flavodoxin WrbA [Lutibacter flavus]
MRRIIVQGSSRNNGNTNKIVQILQNHLECDLINLSELDIHQYDYENGNQNDDFMSTIKKIVEYDLIIFATPVYWYAMSGTMKTFFDRIIECLKTEKEIGYRLRGKNMAAISCGSDSAEHEGFFIPFEKSAGYLGMNYFGHIHTWIEENDPSNSVLELIKDFSKKVK